MSSSDNNITFKKTSFLSGINSEFINRLYSDFLSDPNSLPEGWRKFFNGLSEDEKLILNDLNGPSWSPDKKFKKIYTDHQKDENENFAKDEDAIKQALQFCEMLLAEGKEVYLVDLQDKDPSEMGFKNFTKLIQKTVPLTYYNLMEQKLAI